MKSLAIYSSITFGVVSLILAATPEITVITVADTINPGTADYIIHGIERADHLSSPYLILQLDTPGGLLTSTRSIVQAMLNARVPIVVFVSPRGAHAGSAGALITLAADVAAMAPGTNIGAAHPVAPGAEKMDKTMSEKIANDVAAFAESLAKAKGRNAEWAIKAVRKSASITADEALKQGVIDLTAEDLPDLLKKLPGWKLKIPKQSVTFLPDTPVTHQWIPMNLKQRLVSFFADPQLAYLIMTFGALCLWVELTHPGLIFPGVLGGICLLLSLISFQMLPISYGALGLIVLGIALLVAELFLPTFGLVGGAGLLCFIFGSLFLMDTGVPEFQISLAMVLPTAAVLAGASFLLGFLVMRSRRTRHLSGMESLVGVQAVARELISEIHGKVFLNGELWNAVCRTGQTIPEGTKVVVTEVRNMIVVVQPILEKVII